MTLGARLGLGALALLLGVAAVAVWYVWKRPLSVYAAFNRRALAGAGLTEATADTGFGPQHYWVGGQGQTVVLLHGAGDQSGNWASVVDTLAPRFRLVIPDLAGHGTSAPASGPISMPQIIRGVEAVLSQGPQEPVVIVGNSLGAWVALLYAKEHPDRVARLVLVNGGALKGDRADLAEKLMPKSREEAAALMTQLRDPKSAPIPGYVLDDVVREAGAGPLARFAQTAGEMERYVLDEAGLAAIAAPVNLLWGESDKMFPVAYAQRMIGALKASRLTTLPGCGHVPHQECPTRFRAALLDILQQPPPAAGQ